MAYLRIDDVMDAFSLLVWEFNRVTDYCNLFATQSKSYKSAIAMRVKPHFLAQIIPYFSVSTTNPVKFFR